MFVDKKKRIKPVRLTTAGYGGVSPVNDNSTDELRAINRRVEVYIDEVATMLPDSQQTLSTQK